MPLWSCHIMSHHVTSCPPCGGLLVAIGAGLGQMVHQYTKVYGIWAKMSCDIMSCHITSPSVGSYWCWPGMNGLLKWSTNVQKYMASGPRCPVTSHHIMSPPISATAEGTDLIWSSLERSLNPHFKFWKMESPWLPPWQPDAKLLSNQMWMAKSQVLFMIEI